MLVIFGRKSWETFWIYCKSICLWWPCLVFLCGASHLVGLLSCLVQLIHLAKLRAGTRAITSLKRKIIWAKPSWLLCSMLIFRGVKVDFWECKKWAFFELLRFGDWLLSSLVELGFFLKFLEVPICFSFLQFDLSNTAGKWQGRRSTLIVFRWLKVHAIGMSSSLSWSSKVIYI